MTSGSPLWCRFQPAVDPLRTKRCPQSGSAAHRELANDILILDQARVARRRWLVGLALWLTSESRISTSVQAQVIPKQIWRFLISFGRALCVSVRPQDILASARCQETQTSKFLVDPRPFCCRLSACSLSIAYTVKTSNTTRPHRISNGPRPHQRPATPPPDLGRAWRRLPPDAAFHIKIETARFIMQALGAALNYPKHPGFYTIASM